MIINRYHGSLRIYGDRATVAAAGPIEKRSAGGDNSYRLRFSQPAVITDNVSAG